MMQVYTSIFLSSLLVLALGTNAKSFEAPLPDLPIKAVKELLTSYTEQQPIQTQEENSSNLKPERGSGR